MGNQFLKRSKEFMGMQIRLDSQLGYSHKVIMAHLIKIISIGVD